MTRQFCTVCGGKSIGGLKLWHGKCKWHWAAGVWGRNWAIQQYGKEPVATKPQPTVPSSLQPTLKTHTIGQTWHPVKEDKRYYIGLQFCGYSVPLYVCFFEGRPIATCRTLDKAFHACKVLRMEREATL